MKKHHSIEHKNQDPFIDTLTLATYVTVRINSTFPEFRDALTQRDIKYKIVMYRQVNQTIQIKIKKSDANFLSPMATGVFVDIFDDHTQIVEYKIATSESHIFIGIFASAMMLACMICAFGTTFIIAMSPFIVLAICLFGTIYYQLTIEERQALIKWLLETPNVEFVSSGKKPAHNRD